MVRLRDYHRDWLDVLADHPLTLPVGAFLVTLLFSYVLMVAL